MDIFRELIRFKHAVEGIITGYHPNFDLYAAQDSRPKRIGPLKSQKALLEAARDGRLEDVVLDFDVSVSNPGCEAELCTAAATYVGIADGKFFQFTPYKQVLKGSPESQINDLDYWSKMCNSQLPVVEALIQSNTGIQMSFNAMPLKVEESPAGQRLVYDNNQQIGKSVVGKLSLDPA
jgi:hypothetical protein